MDKGRRVLIIDDEEGIAEFSKRMLQLKGYEASTALDGLGAVEKFKTEHSEIVLIDISLGLHSIDGLEVLKRIKEIAPETQCIMVTRLTDGSIIEKARSLGAFHYLLKPLESRDMLKAVEEAAATIH